MAEKKSRYKTVNVALTPEQHKLIKATSKKYGISISAFLRMSVLEKIKEQGG